ncbi:Phosphatidylserine/phosphatidylglycerophosphate/cardiolipin synthase [Pelomyxa schiedti]|nr:Phosphatidylserine/phosphatidylglycerophosphate/cardiolipin synthase [Pelomyxa schiedti]
MSAHPITPEPAQFPSQCTYPCRSGNDVVPLIDGVEAFDRIYTVSLGAIKSVWVAISFVQLDWEIVSGVNFLDHLSALASRGVDVRLLFWRPAPVISPTASAPVNLETATYNTFFKNSVKGTPAQMEWLTSKGYNSIQMRWDASPNSSHCHHEKTWLIDIGTEGEVVFTGGMVLTDSSHSKQGHMPPDAGVHDIYVQLRGPAAVDVAHSFVQRWNSVSCPSCIYPSESSSGNLEWPTFSLHECGTATVQVQRNIHPHLYPAAPPPIGTSEGFDITEGEDSILCQYRNAIASAQHTIYMENQHFAHPEILQMLIAATLRGVKVIAVVPSFLLSQKLGTSAIGPHIVGNILYGLDWVYRTVVRATKPKPSYSTTFLDIVPSLGNNSNFLLCGIAVDDASPSHQPACVYVHSKVMIVDDKWWTVGSANCVDLSLNRDHTELNLSIWDPATALALRRRLFLEHCGTCPFLNSTPEPPEPEPQQQSSPTPTPAATSTTSATAPHTITPEQEFEWFSSIAKSNTSRVMSGIPPAPGTMAWALDPCTYGTGLFGVSLVLEHCSTMRALLVLLVVAVWCSNAETVYSAESEDCGKPALVTVDFNGNCSEFVLDQCTQSPSDWYIKYTCLGSETPTPDDTLSDDDLWLVRDLYSGAECTDYIGWEALRADCNWIIGGGSVASYIDCGVSSATVYSCDSSCHDCDVDSTWSFGCGGEVDIYCYGSGASALYYPFSLFLILLLFSVLWV